MNMFNIYLAVLFAVLHVALFDVCPDTCQVQDPLQAVLKLAANNCSEDNGTRVEYWIYNQIGGKQITSPNDIDNTKPVKILIHGWAGNKNIPYIQVIKDAYIQQNSTRYNIIIVDYGMYAPDGSLLTYANAYCNVPVVAISVANFMCQLHTTRGVNPNDIHIVGHSLGSHIGGIAGDLVKTQCDIIIGRITGLDPAGPGFMCILCNVKRLDKTNAVFVDVIHTNMDGYGTSLESGDVDFYVNGGLFQPGCSDEINIAAIIHDPIHIMLASVSCSHQRSCYLFAESILLNSFKDCSIRILGLCVRSNGVYMGEYCRTMPADDIYEVYTKDQSPFGYGPNGPIN